MYFYMSGSGSYTALRPLLISMLMPQIAAQGVPCGVDFARYNYGVSYPLSLAGVNASSCAPLQSALCPGFAGILMTSIARMSFDVCALGASRDLRSSIQETKEGLPAGDFQNAATTMGCFWQIMNSVEGIKPCYSAGTAVPIPVPCRTVCQKVLKGLNGNVDAAANLCMDLPESNCVAELSSLTYGAAFANGPRLTFILLIALLGSLFSF